MKFAGRAHGCSSPWFEGGRVGGRIVPVLSVVRRLQMQGLLASIFAQVAEVGVFFAAAAALVAGALMLR